MSYPIAIIRVFIIIFNTMGIASKTTRTAKLRRGPTKFQKTRRIVRIHKKVQRRTAERALRQQKKSAFIKKRNQRAENEVIEVI